MSHGSQGEGWGIMWDNRWIAWASENQKGGKRGRKTRRWGRAEGLSRDSLRGRDATTGGDFCVMAVEVKFIRKSAGGDFYERREESSWTEIRESTARNKYSSLHIIPSSSSALEQKRLCGCEHN